MPRVIVYTDGACSGNPGPGGWGAILIFQDGTKRELSRSVPDTTNQRMELAAAIGALEALTEADDVVLHSDSAYLVNCFRDRWYVGWRRNNWKGAKRKPVKNRDLWERLLALTDARRVEFVKVAGHADDVRNNRCDELAQMACEGRTPERA
jgi:ribonuclease HI